MLCYLSFYSAACNMCKVEPKKSARLRDITLNGRGSIKEGAAFQSPPIEIPGSGKWCPPTVNFSS